MLISCQKGPRISQRGSTGEPCNEIPRLSAGLSDTSVVLNQKFLRFVCCQTRDLMDSRVMSYNKWAWVKTFKEKPQVLVLGSIDCPVLTPRMPTGVKYSWNPTESLDHIHAGPRSKKSGPPSCQAAIRAEAARWALRGRNCCSTPNTRGIG